MSTPLTPSQAKLWTVGAQVASLILVLSAVTVGIVGLPEHAPGSSLEKAKANAWPTQSPENPSGVGQSNAGDRAEIDTLGLAERLALLDNAPVPVDNTVIETPTEPESSDPGPTYGAGLIVRRVKYIGFINSAKTQHAFIRIDGKQRIVRMGEIAKSGDEQFDDLKVERITPNRIVLSDGENTAEIRLADKSGPSVTMVSGDDVAVAAAEPEDPTKLTDEEEAMIASLPARQQPMARRRLEREKRGLPAEKENRRPTPEPLVTVRGSLNRNGPSPRRQNRDD